jgi:uncharacterized membrane protein
MASLQPFQNLIALTLALVAPLAVLALLRFNDRRWAARIGLTLFLLMTSSAHFLSTDRMALMLPEWTPQRPLLIYLTGLLELGLAAGLWVPGWTKIAGGLIAAILLLFLPANIYAAWNSLPFGGNVLGPTYLWFRVPLQFFFMFWALWATGWINRSGRGP